MLIVTVLLQPGKTDAGALFTSSVSSNAYGSRGTATVLSKTTIITATLFMLLALMLSMPAFTGNVSVLSSNPEAPAEAPAANSQTDVPAANPADANSNSVAPAANTNTEPAKTETNANAPAANK